MKRNSRVVEYYKGLMDKAHLRLVNAEEYYISQCEAHVRFFLNNGCFSCEIKERKVHAYEDFCKAYVNYKRLEEKYFQVKGCVNYE